MEINLPIYNVFIRFKVKATVFFHKFPEGTVEKQKRELLIWGNPVENKVSGTPNTVTEDTDNFVI